MGRHTCRRPKAAELYLAAEIGRIIAAARPASEDGINRLKGKSK
jgi:hypothetical protein